jgi:curved DNA-binding protein
LLGPPAAGDTDADVLVSLPLARVEASRGGKKRIALPGDAGGADVLVTIPAGVRNGTRLRLRGKGRRRPDGRRGDAYLVITVREG